MGAPRCNERGRALRRPPLGVDVNLQEPISFLSKILGPTVGFIVFAVIVAAYFPVLIAWFVANNISMGIFSMLTVGEPSKN